MTSDYLKELYNRAIEAGNQRDIAATCTTCSMKIASYLCYACNTYLCNECIRKHTKSHDMVAAKSDIKVREMQAMPFLETMRLEVTDKKDFTGENLEVCGRLKVKYDFDEIDCDINAFCGLGDKQWVALDINNFSIKIFDFVNNSLIRCVGFDLKPWGVTEIKAKNPHESKSTKLKPESIPLHPRESKSTKLKPESLPLHQKQVAVTYPHVKQIWILDLKSNPAVKSQMIQMNKKCFHLDFSDDTIFTLCREDDEQDCYSVHALDITGNALYILPNTSPSYISSIAVSLDRLYLTSSNDKKVLCVDQKGSIQSEISIHALEPLCITVDQDKKAYICCGGDDRIYRVDRDLKTTEILDINTEYTQQPFKICLFKHKLYISHLEPSLHNTVTVIQLT